MRTSGWRSTVCLDACLERQLLISVVVDFYNHINLLYGSITEFCSPQSCPEMKATDEYVASLYRPCNYRKY
jgi:MOB kinase activator 1